MMNDNRTGCVCDNCNSHIQKSLINGKFIVICQYCGYEPEDMDSIDFGEDYE